jgi:hypothetical protein
MATPQREWKHIQRKLRGIPVDQIGPYVTAWERDGLWCLVAGYLTFVSADGSGGETTFEDPLVDAQFVRYVQARPERVHATYESAQAFVRSRLGRG